MEPSFILFSLPHVYGLLGAFAAASMIVLFHKRWREPLVNRRIRYSIAGLLIVSEASLYTWYTLRDAWGWYALPFQLCTLTLWFSVFALLTRNRKAYDVVFFLGILGALQALLTPYLTVTLPDFRYFHFFLAHIGIIASGLFLTVVEGYRPTLWSALRAWVWLNVLAVPAAIANAVTGNNFMFLARKPETGSLLDWLAPWPWYIAQLELIALAMCFLLWAAVCAVDRFTK